MRYLNGMQMYVSRISSKPEFAGIACSAGTAGTSQSTDVAFLTYVSDTGNFLAPIAKCQSSRATGLAGIAGVAESTEFALFADIGDTRYPVAVVAEYQLARATGAARFARAAESTGIARAAELSAGLRGK